MLAHTAVKCCSLYIAAPGAGTGAHTATHGIAITSISWAWYTALTAPTHSSSLFFASKAGNAALTAPEHSSTIFVSTFFGMCWA